MSSKEGVSLSPKKDKKEKKRKIGRKMCLESDFWRNNECVFVCWGRRRNDRKGLKVDMKVLCVFGLRLYMLHIHTPGNPEGSARKLEM